MQVRHAAIRELIAYVAPAQRPALAAQLDQETLLGEANTILLAEICELTPEAISRHHSLELRYLAAMEEKLGDLAGDARTMELLVENWRRRIERKSNLDRAPTSRDELTLHTSGKTLQVVIPSCLDSYLILFEVFLDRCYRVSSRVSVFYDLGAHVGLTTLYMHEHLPGARFVCVEPVSENADLLEENLWRNGIEADVRRCAVGAARTRATLYVCPEATGTSSLFARSDIGDMPLGRLSTNRIEVEVVPIDEVIQTGDCGIKLDIEGAEHGLSRFLHAWRKACWVAGEFHMGPTIVPLDQAWDLCAALGNDFVLAIEGPGVFGNSVTFTFNGRRN